MKKNTYVIIYGRGGHQEQMSRLLKHGLFCENETINKIVFTDSVKSLAIDNTQIFIFREFRDKHSNFKTIVFLPLNTIRLFYRTLLILYKYKVKGVITTGPGIAIIPCILFRLFGKNLVVFESWSKFNQSSITSKILYKFAGLFIIQNKSMQKVFPKAKYWGRL